MKTRKSILIVVVALFAMGTMASGVWAKKRADAVRIKVMNCSTINVSASSYNGRDGYGFAKESKQVPKDGGHVQLKCRGQGKGRCRIKTIAKSGLSSRSIKREVKDGHWLLVKATLDVNGKVSALTGKTSSSKPSCN